MSADAKVAVPDRLFPRAWPVAILALGLILTLGWAGLLAYEIFALLELAL
jgi:hypothetical protein